MTTEATYAFAGTTTTVLVGGEETAGGFALLHVAKPDGSSTPPHSHDEETELAYPLAGTVGVETEGRIARFRPGEPILLPPGRPHRLFNDSGAAARELLLYAPAIFDRFVAAAGTRVAPGSEPSAMTEEDRLRLIAATPEFGIRLLRSAAPADRVQGPVVQLPEPFDLIGTRVEVAARLGSAADDLVLLRHVVPAWRSVPLHRHVDPECIFVVAGSVQLCRADTAWHDVGAGQAVHIGPGIDHAIRNVSDIAVELLVVTTVHMAHLLRRLGTQPAGSEPSQPLPEELAAFSRSMAGLR